ncbi:MAG TPA: hypothetical protein VMD03_08810 [Steroidobacteraceae bacterium]|nr:hypothetical protein [Steroidobacteraceae bacterium]
MDPKLVTPIVVGALVVWGIYRRMRRSFGRQRVDANRLIFRIGILAVIGALVVIPGVRDSRTVGGLVAGIACGAALAFVGLRHTKFETTPEGRFYTPHTYIGVGVMVLFLARLLYRFIYLYSNGQAMTAAHQNLALAYQRSPLTVGMFGALVSYYVLFYVGVLLKTRTPALPVGTSSTE